MSTNLYRLIFCSVLCVVLTQMCVTGFYLPINYHPDLEALLRKVQRKHSSSPPSGSQVQQIINQFQSLTVQPPPMAANKTVNNYSAPSSSNIPLG